MELLSAISNLASLKKFIEEDLLSVFASLELRAATNALSSLSRAKDKKSVYWSAINHLETAEEGLKAQLKSSNRFQAAKQYIYLSALKATIYKYLGEGGLVEKCFEDSVNVVKTHNINAKKYEFHDTMSWWNPKTWIDMFSFQKSNIGKVSITFNSHEFWKQMVNKNENFGLLVIDTDPGYDGNYMEYR